jgi:hypothetical protein
MTIRPFDTPITTATRDQSADDPVLVQCLLRPGESLKIAVRRHFCGGLRLVV